MQHGLGRLITDYSATLCENINLNIHSCQQQTFKKGQKVHTQKTVTFRILNKPAMNCFGMYFWESFHKKKKKFE